MTHNGWIECPECHTGYRAERCGVPLDVSRQATVVCSVCKCDFNVNVVISHSWEQKSRWNPLKQEVQHTTVEILKRGA